MAIMSFVVGCDNKYVNDVVVALKKIPHLELYDVYNGYQVVALVEIPSNAMESFIANVKAIPHIQTCEVTYMSVEDELE